MPEIAERSRLPVDIDQLWSVISTMNGVNAELWPLVRMSVPRHARDQAITDAPLGQVAFTSWLLVCGVLPFDRHRLCLVAIDPGRGFLERSSSWLQRVWEHERTLTAVESGTQISDRVRFEPRIKALAPIVTPIVAAVFRHRHAQLRTRFGG